MIKKLTNAQVLLIMRAINEDAGKDLLKKKLPVQILFALHKSLPGVEAAYKAYSETLNAIGEQYGADFANAGKSPLKADNPDDQADMNAAIAALLNEKVDVDVHTFKMNVIESLDDSRFDPLSFVEIECLWWLIDETAEDDEDDEEVLPL